MARFQFRFWEPPKISDDEKFKIGKFANENGISGLLLRFMHIPIQKVFDSGMTKEQLFEYWLPVIVYAGLAALGVSLNLAGDYAFDSKETSNIGEALWAVGLIALFVSAIFYFLSLLNYYLWIRKLMDFHEHKQ